MIVEFAAIYAIGHSSQSLGAVETPVGFDVVVDGNTVGTGPAEFACPLTGLYFVHYRLRARRENPANSESCIMSLFVGTNEVEVSL